MAGQIIDLAHESASPTGGYLHNWSQERCDQAVADCFGYHALQIGMPAWPLLHNSRIQHRWVAATNETCEKAPTNTPTALTERPNLVLHSAALPFADASIDLMVLPYALEASANPHATLREAARVLMPEGHLLILGLNPASLWGMQHKKRFFAQHLGSRVPPLFPGVRQWLGFRTLRDWLQLLNFEISGGRFGCYRPILRNVPWFERLQWLEAAGDRWWPSMGGVYFLHAIKRVHGAYLMHPNWSLAQQTGSSAPAAASVNLHGRIRLHTVSAPSCNP